MSLKQTSETVSANRWIAQTSLSDEQTKAEAELNETSTSTSTSKSLSNMQDRHLQLR